MVTKVNGGVSSGVFFSKDVAFVNVASANILAAEEGVEGSNLEQVCEVLQQYGNIIAMQVENGVALHLIMDYAQALGTSNTTVGGQAGTDVIAALETALDAILTTSTTTVGELRVA